MQVTVKQGDLARALGAAVSVVESRTTIPVLANVRLHAMGETLSIRATDLDTEIDLGCACSVKVPGVLTAPADVLHRLARKFPGDAEIGITYLSERQRLRLACGRSHYDLPVLPPEDFPELGGDIVGGMPLEGRVLKAALMRVAFAISREETRYYLGGVYIHRDGEQLVAVATTGHMLAKDAITLPPQAGDFPGVILPRKFVDQALRLLPEDATEDSYLAVTASRVALFLPDGTRLVSKLIEGAYPDYKRVIPVNNEHMAVLPRAALVAAIERAMVMLERGKDSGRCLRLLFSAGALSVMSYTDSKGFASERLDIVFDGKRGQSLELGLNPGFVLDVLARFGGDTVTLWFGDPATPTLWRDSADGGPALAVVMPMRVATIPSALLEAA